MSEYTRFKDLRIENRYTQKELAEVLNLKSWQTCKGIESGKQKVSPEIALMVEDKLNISGWWLLTGRGDKYLNSCNGININNSTNSNVAINGTITINTKDYADNDEIQEVVNLLKYASKPLLDKFVEKLNKVKKDTEEF